jgi:hypothetical protein
LVNCPCAGSKRRWFVGAHSNIGGGYKNDTLGQSPLAWLQSRAETLGLHFTQPVTVDRNAHLTKPVDSYGKFLFHAYQVFTLGRRFYRPIGILVNKVEKGWSFPVNETIDASVFRRCADVPNYRPKNLLDWSQRTNRPLAAIGTDHLAATG